MVAGAYFNAPAVFRYAILLILEINKKYTIALTEKKHQRLGMNDI